MSTLSSFDCYYWMWIILLDEDRGRRHDSGMSSTLTQYYNYNVSYFNYFDISFLLFILIFFSTFSSTTVCLCLVCVYVQQRNVGSQQIMQCGFFECYTHVLVFVNFYMYTCICYSMVLHMLLLLKFYTCACICELQTAFGLLKFCKCICVSRMHNYSSFYNLINIRNCFHKSCGCHFKSLKRKLVLDR
jgi:hypothetical protein